MKTPLPRTPHRRAGFTLIEVAIGITILAAITGVMAMVGVTSSDLFKTCVERSGVEIQVRRSLDRLRAALLVSGLDTLDPRPAGGLWSSDLTFDQLQGMTDDRGRVIWRSMSAGLEMARGEVDDGVDNNGNGLVDERNLVLIRDVGEAEERRIVLSRWVRELYAGETANGLDDNGNGLIDEAGFCYRLRGDSVDLFLTLERIDGKGRTITRSLETSVLLRN